MLFCIVATIWVCVRWGENKRGCLQAQETNNFIYVAYIIDLKAHFLIQASEQANVLLSELVKN